jgi:uncharacterized protein YerC
MTKLSKQKLDPKDFGLYVSNLWLAFALLDSKDQIRSLFRDLYTHTEYKMFAKRFEIARRLLENQTYEEIRTVLKVTDHTIATVSNILERDGEGLRIAHKKLKDLEKNRKHSRFKLPRYKRAPRISELINAF